MTVDENNLDVVIRSLHGLVAMHNTKAVEANNLLAAFKKIHMKTDGTLPTDQDTNQPMSQNRRDEIYDNCLAQAYLALGLNEDGSTKE